LDREEVREGTMFRKTPIAVLVALTALTAGTAQAQFDRIRRPDSGAVNSTTRGDGRLEIGRNTTRELDRASVALRRGGRAEVRLYRGSTPYVFTGTWDGRRSDVVDLQLDRRDGVRIDATGRVWMGRGDDVQRIEIDGRERGERLTAGFRSDGDGGGSGGGTWTPSQARRGDGRLLIGRETARDLDRASVSLRRGGAAEVRVYRGSTPYVFTGTWTERGRNTVDLRLDRRDRQPISADGTVTFRPNGELAGLTITGSEDRERLRVSFRAEGSGSGSGSGPFDYIDAADEARRHQERRR
jgi:hypothetical protein